MTLCDEERLIQPSYRLFVENQRFSPLGAYAWTLTPDSRNRLKLENTTDPDTRAKIDGAYAAWANR